VPGGYDYPVASGPTESASLLNAVEHLKRRGSCFKAERGVVGSCSRDTTKIPAPAYTASFLSNR
jgi:hypothetical protein